MITLVSMIRRLGNAGAVANAQRACAERQDAERAVVARLAAMQPIATAPVKAA
jgi:hypothetical protein